MLINIIFIIAGFGISLYSFFEISVWGSLYFDRNYHCIDKYRSMQKRCDAISALHNLAAWFAGMVTAFAGLAAALGRVDIPLAPWFLAGLFALAADGTVLFLTARLSAIPVVRNRIKRQWDTQKTVSPENDHEVNMYRGAVRICDTYPRHAAFCLTLLLAAWCRVSFIFP